MRSALILEILSRIRKRDYSAQDLLTAVVKLSRELGLEDDAATLAVWHRRGRTIGVWYRRSMTQEAGLTDELQVEAAKFIVAACGFRLLTEADRCAVVVADGTSAAGKLRGAEATIGDALHVLVASSRPNLHSWIMEFSESLAAADSLVDLLESLGPAVARGVETMMQRSGRSREETVDSLFDEAMIQAVMGDDGLLCIDFRESSENRNPFWPMVYRWRRGGWSEPSVSVN